jgi:hypothetical protein
MSKCYICGATYNVNCRNHCEQEGSVASVQYCGSCAEKYVNLIWKEIPTKNQGDWIRNEAAFWALYNGAKEMYLNTKIKDTCFIDIPKIEQKVEKSK